MGVGRGVGEGEGKREVRNRLKHFRHQHEMNQKEFASFLGISYYLYNKYERQIVQPSLETALDISAKLKIPINDFIYKEKKMESAPGE